MRKTHYILLAALLFATCLQGQTRFKAIEQKLDSLSASLPGLKETVDFSVNGVKVQEFVRAIAATHNLNISIDENIDVKVINTFSNAEVTNVLIFLCRKYELDITLVGNIISISKYNPPPAPPKKREPKPISIGYNDQTNFLSLDLKRDSLERVAKEITKKTLRNIILAPGLENELVSVFIQNRPFDNAMEKMAFANNLSLTKTSDNFYLLEKVAESNKGGNTKKLSVQGSSQNNSIQASVEGGKISLTANNAEISEIIKQVSAGMLKNYFLFSVPSGKTSVLIENADYESFLTYLLNGTEFTYKNEDGIYLIGKRDLERLRVTELVQLQNRTVESIIDFIPADLQKGVEIKEFLELNGLVVSGSAPRVMELKKFVRDIDRIVPVVMIEVMIVDAKKTRNVSTGISAGVSDQPVQSQGTLLPSIDFTLSSGAVNDLINSFNGFGIFNLGNVTPNFYMSLQALEDEGMIKIHSTPKLATINGLEANMSIGNTEYYLETANNIIGSQNPQNVVTQTYKTVRADLSISVKPIVSGDDMVTLEISVDQSDFTARISQNAPPGSVSRNFKSTVRMRNQEMILLGGLEEQVKEKTGTGLPLLSRLPVLKYLFSSRSDRKEKSQLNVFIRPTIVY